MADPALYLVLCVCGDEWWRSSTNPKVTSQAAVVGIDENAMQRMQGSAQLCRCCIAGSSACMLCQAVVCGWEPVWVGGGDRGGLCLAL